MAVLEIDADIDYSVNDVFDVNAISFTNAAGSATAVFRANQVDGVQLATGLLVSGSVGVNGLVFGGGSLTVRGWAFDLWGAEDKVTLNGSGGADTLEGMARGVLGQAVLNGLAGNDVLISNTDGTDLYGGKGQDILFSNSGVVNGGAGTDYFSNSGQREDVLTRVDISDGGGGRATGFGVTLTGIERIWVEAGSFDDVLIGGALSDTLDGGGGADRLSGGKGVDSLRGLDGADTLEGGASGDLISGDKGADLLTGGGGADRFIFNPIADRQAGVNGTDRITDFQVGYDKIDLYLYGIDPDNTDHDHIVFVGETTFVDYIPTQVRVAYTATDTVLQIGSFRFGVGFKIVLTGLIDLTAADFIL